MKIDRDILIRYSKCSNNDVLMGIQANNYAYTSGGWSVPTQEMIDSYEEGDKRLSVSIAVAEGTALSLCLPETRTGSEHKSGAESGV